MAVYQERQTPDCPSGACSSTNPPDSQQNQQNSALQPSPSIQTSATSSTTLSILPSSTTIRLSATEGASGLTLMQLGIIIGSVVGCALVIGALLAFCVLQRQRHKTAISRAQLIPDNGPANLASFYHDKTYTMTCEKSTSSSNHSPTLRNQYLPKPVINHYNRRPSPHIRRPPTIMSGTCSGINTRKSQLYAESPTPQGGRTLDSMQSTLRTSIFEKETSAYSTNPQNPQTQPTYGMSNRPYISMPLAVESTALHLRPHLQDLAGNSVLNLPTGLSPAPVGTARMRAPLIVQPSQTRLDIHVPRQNLEVSANEMLFAHENVAFMQASNVSIVHNDYLSPGTNYLQPVSENTASNTRHTVWPSDSRVACDRQEAFTAAVRPEEIGMAMSPTSLYSFPSRNTFESTSRRDATFTSGETKASSCLLPNDQNGHTSSETFGLVRTLYT